MEFIDILKNRRSVRKYSEENIPEEKLNRILQAGLLSASSRAIRPWEFIVVQDKDTLDKLSDCRIGSAKMLANAKCAVVVIANEEKSDTWIEDCCVAMTNMHNMADSLGIGSCWIQGRLREAPDQRSTEEYVRSILHFPEGYKLESILSLGMPEQKGVPYQLEELLYEKIHKETF